MNNLNIIWIYADSVRRYHSTPEAIEAGDDRSRLNFMDEFSKESVEFINTVTSAPSTQMSISAMAASLPSFYLATNFNDYFFGNIIGSNIARLLKNNNYKIYGFLQSQRNREFNHNLFTPINNKYWPRGLSHLKYWNNNDINLTIENALKFSLDKPALFFINYNCRKDPETSNQVKWVIDKFNKSGYTKENTIIILCSDHGYPDPSKNTGNPEFYIKNKLTHDLVLTDDNIMIPLLIRYPRCPIGKKINTTVSSLDIFPTILDLLEIKYKNIIHGMSLIPLIDGDEEYNKIMKSRFHRCDSRLLQQTGKATAIRNGTYKYIFYHDNLRNCQNEEFYDINNDPFELNNLINDNNQIIQDNLNVFREQLLDSDKNASIFQFRHLLNTISFNHRNYLENGKCVLITDSSTSIYIDLIIKKLRDYNNTISIYLFQLKNEFNYHDNYISVIKSGFNNWYGVNEMFDINKLNEMNIDMVIVPINNSDSPDNINLRKFVQQLKTKQKVFLDYNIVNYNKTIQGYYFKRLMIVFRYLKYQPHLLVATLFKISFKIIIDRIRTKNHVLS